MRPSFIGAIGIITDSLGAGRQLYVGALGLPLRHDKGTRFLHSTKLGGARYFGVWPLSEAAKVCFGRNRWPSGRPVPQLFIEFEIARPTDVAIAAAELEAKGYRLLHGARVDPWGQTVARLQTKDGLLVGISYVPWMHRSGQRRRGRSRQRQGKGRPPGAR